MYLFFFKVFKIYKFRIRTCAIFTVLLFFVYDLELFIDAFAYKRPNSTMTFLVVKINKRRPPKIPGGAYSLYADDRDDRRIF